MANKSKILKFSKKQEHRINSVNIIDNTLFFTDNNSEPKRIELDRFRNADHSSGTTNVYGRPFQERDITVIRNTPMKSLDVGLSKEVVPIEADIPKIITGAAYPYKTTANLNASLTSEGADIKTVGFYYVQQDTLPSKADILKGKYQSANFVSGSFVTSISGLTKLKRYWYIAVGYNGINELEVAINNDGSPMIKSFETKGDTFTDPTVDTIKPLKLNEGISKFKLQGKISGNGGSNIVETGFYILTIEDTESQTKPSSIYTNPKAKLSYASRDEEDPVSAEGFAQYAHSPFVNGFKNFWIQFYATNAAGRTGYGDVEGPRAEDLVARPLPGIEIVDGVFLENGDASNIDIILEVDVQVTYKPGQIREVGVYFSKIADDKTTILNYYNGQPAGDRQVWKVEADSLSSLDVAAPFKVSDEGNTEFTIQPGDKVYALAYIECFIDGAIVKGYSDYDISVSDNGFQANPFSHIKKPDTSPPSVITEKFFQSEESSTQCIACELNVIGNGIGSKPIPGVIAAEGNEVTSCGFIIAEFNPTEKILMDGYSDAQKRYYILDLLAQDEATEFVFTDSSNNVITSSGEHEDNFFPNNVVSLVGNNYYYGFAWATNNISPTPGYGEVLSFQYKAPDDDTEPSVGLRFYQNPDGQAMYIGQTAPDDEILVSFVGVIDRWVKGQDQIHDYGVVWQATTKDNFDFDASVTAGRKASFVSIGTESDEHHYSYYSPYGSSQKNKINTALTTHLPNTIPNNKTNFFGILLETDVFTDVSYTNNQSQTYSAQLYIQYTNGGEYVKGTLVGPGNVTETQDIREFTIREDTTYNYAVPELKLEQDSVSINKAEVTASFLEISSNFSGDQVPAIEDINLYYKPTSVTSGATDAAKIANVVSSGYKIDYFDENGKNFSYNQGQWRKGDYFKVYFGDDFQQYHPVLGPSASYPELDANTEYYMVATAKTGTTSTSDISSLGAGVGYSNLLTLKTKEEPKSDVYWKSYSVNVFDGQRDGIVLFRGSLSENVVKTSLSLYIIPKSDIGANPTSSQIVVHNDTITIDAFTSDDVNKEAVGKHNKTSQDVVRYYRNLEDGTSYWYVWGARVNGYGEILSPPDDFKTNYNLNMSSNGSIRTPLIDKYIFNKGGGRLIPTQQEIASEYAATSPNYGFMIPFSTAAPGRPVGMEIIGAYPENAKNSLFLSQDSRNGKRYIRAAVNSTQGLITGTRRWKVLLYFSDGPHPLNQQLLDSYATYEYIYFEQSSTNTSSGSSGANNNPDGDYTIQVT